MNCSNGKINEFGLVLSITVSAACIYLCNRLKSGNQVLSYKEFSNGNIIGTLEPDINFYLYRTFLLQHV